MQTVNHNEIIINLQKFSNNYFLFIKQNTKNS